MNQYLDRISVNTSAHFLFLSVIVAGVSAWMGWPLPFNGEGVASVFSQMTGHWKAPVALSGVLLFAGVYFARNHHDNTLSVLYLSAFSLVLTSPVLVVILGLFHGESTSFAQAFVIVGATGAWVSAVMLFTDYLLAAMQWIFDTKSSEERKAKSPFLKTH